MEDLNHLKMQRIRDANNIKTQNLKYYEPENCQQFKDDIQIGETKNLVLKTKMENKNYVKKLYHNIQIGDYYQNTIQTIFTQMISNFDEDPAKETLFLKIKGFSMRVGQKEGSWAEFYEMLKCDLQNHIKSLDSKNLRHRFFLCWKISKAIRILQDHYIVHSDIKPGNILVDDRDQPVLADFDTIEFLTRDQAETKSKGFTPRWAPPELVCEDKINFGTDVWSMGCVIIYIFTGCSPWGKILNQREVIEMI